MTAPLQSSSKPMILRDNAPFSRWGIQGSFDSAKDCKEAQYNYMSAPDAWKYWHNVVRESSGKTLGTEFSFHAVPSGFCIATDYPRLRSDRSWLMTTHDLAELQRDEFLAHRLHCNVVRRAVAVLVP